MLVHYSKHQLTEAEQRQKQNKIKNQPVTKVYLYPCTGTEK